ncbi:glycosyltransferase [Nesterenkonia populi]
MQIIGHTRFSVYSYGGSGTAGLNATQTTEEEYLAWLYDEERLAARTETFIEEVLPQLERSIDGRGGISHVASYSSSLLFLSRTNPR